MPSITVGTPVCGSARPAARWRVGLLILLRHPRAAARVLCDGPSRGREQHRRSNSPRPTCGQLRRAGAVTRDHGRLRGSSCSSSAAVSERSIRPKPAVASPPSMSLGRVPQTCGSAGCPTPLDMLDCVRNTWLIQDLGSNNGTLVNGVPVGRSRLRPGDTLAVADQVLRVD